MSDPTTDQAPPAAVTVRWWAAARAAAGTDHDEVAPGPLRQVLAAAVARHEGPHTLGDAARLQQVLAACSLLVDGVTAGAGGSDREVTGGSVIEVLPPFAGG